MQRTLEDEFTDLQLDTEEIVIETAAMLKRRYDDAMDKVINIISAWYIRNDINSLTEAQSNMDSLMAELSEVMDPASEEYIEKMSEHFALVFAYNLQESQRILGLEETSDEDALLLFTVLGIGSIAWTEDELTYKDRMALRNTQLKNQIRQTILRDATIDVGTKKLLKDLEHEMSKAKYRGTNVLVDESNHAANEAVKYVGERNFSGYIISEVLDAKTCELCASMHGRTFQWSEYDVGLTAPQFHTCCRGRVIPMDIDTANQ